MMKKLIFLILFLVGYVPPTLGGANFAAQGEGVREEYLQAAEDARKNIAVFWTGKPLRGNWSRACSLHVSNEGEHFSSSGATTFKFDRGQVFGWSMQVQGSRTEIRRSVIPHEVQHTIIATFTRKPIPRWLDEGMAAMFESQEEQTEIRRNAVRYLDHTHNVFRHFDDTQYPPGDREGILAVYATGFSFVEWLVEQKGKETLWAFAIDTRKPSEKFQEFYGVSVSTAWGRWRTWARDRDVATRSPMQTWFVGYEAPVQKSAESKPTLYVFKNSAIFCLGCHNFDMAYLNNPAFRDNLQARYKIVYVDVADESGAALARSHGVKSVPAFVPENASSHVEGFEGTAWLIGHLRGLKTTVVRIQDVAPPPPVPRRIEDRSRPIRVQPSQPVFEPLTPHLVSTGCRCRACFTAAFNRIKDLESRLAALERTAGPTGRSGDDGSAGVGVTAMRIHENKLQVKYTNNEKWEDVGVFPVIKQVITVKDTDGTTLDSDTYSLGKQPIIIQFRASPAVLGLNSRVKALEPLLRREVRLYVNGKLTDSLAGEEALKPGDPIPIYAVPRSGVARDSSN